jgi:tetrahydromethanopterin S-methyltransferase subunit F
MDFTVCDAVAGCLYVNHDCSGTSGTNNCHLASCKNDTCVVSEVDGTLDACGTCNGDVNSEAECVLLANKVAVGIGAGAIAGIIIGGVSAAVVVGFGSKKGYDYYQARFGEKASMIADNPLYEEKGSSKVNPLFEQEMEESSSV